MPAKRTPIVHAITAALSLAKAAPDPCTGLAEQLAAKGKVAQQEKADRDGKLFPVEFFHDESCLD
jgi:hypothetical protein